MRKIALQLVAVCITTSVMAQIRVDDFRKESDRLDDSKAMTRALAHLDSIGHGTLEFTGTKEYIVYKNVELPRHSKSGRRIFILNGNGCRITARPGVIVFNRIPKNQDEALNKMMSTRFAFNDFTIKGGAKAINIGATYGTSINRCNFEVQTEAAIDIQFGLNTVISHCNSNNAKKDNFVLRHGADWGGNGINSQSNHSEIRNSRVYAGAGSQTAFKVLASSGVVLRDNISEGSKEIDFSVYVDRLNSNTVRLFKLENLHLEHAPRKAGIYIRSTGVNTFDGIFYQLAYKGFPLFDVGNGSDQINLYNVPHYVNGTIIKQKNMDAAAWNLMGCNAAFLKKENWCVGTKSGDWEAKRPFYFYAQGYRYHIKKEYGIGK
jgi:hypothetical protein